ncbi:MAG TPA: hypothetical protein ENI86_11850 [Acidimicrobiales bacterium]|nr:hypothetical protein [Acidimicrobiales bacterium]
MLLVLLGITAWMVVLTDVRAGSGSPAGTGPAELQSPPTGLVVAVDHAEPPVAVDPEVTLPPRAANGSEAASEPRGSGSGLLDGDPTAADYFGGIDPPVVAPDASERLVGRSIDVVGDSLGVSVTDELRALLPGSALHVDAEVGRPLSVALSSLRAVGRSAPDIVVIEIGTNDWGVPAGYEDQVRRALEAVEGASCVVWVNAQEFRSGLVTVNRTIDTVLGEVAAERPETAMTVARWSDLADPPELHGADGYHLSAQGQRLMADLIVATVVDTCTS